MKLWQKVFLYTLALVMLAVGMTSILLLRNSFSMALDQKKQGVSNEHRFAVEGFKSMAVTERLKENAIVLDEEELARLMEEAFGKKGQDNGILFLNSGNERVYANRDLDYPESLLDVVKESGNSYVQARKSKMYVASAEKIEGKEYYVVTEHDMSEVVRMHEDMLGRILAISMGCAVGIAILLLVLVKILLHPLQRINEGTRAIAGGSYTERIPEKGRDELSELAHNMNLMAEAVETNVRALEEVAEDRKQFIDNLSHEMKTPLTSILGFADLLQIQKEVSDESRMEYAGIIKEEASRLRALSGKLMELITVGRGSLEYREEDMRQLFEESGASLKILTDSHNLEFSCHSESGKLLIEKELFKSLLYNLVDNAVKASREGGHVRMEGHFADGSFIVEVEDEGVGIPEEEIGKISRAFYMVDKARDRARGGAGLGLALCEEIVSLHQGKMRFESKLGEGTKVCVFIPRERGMA